jgi:hypothetical protein
MRWEGEGEQRDNEGGGLFNVSVTVWSGCLELLPPQGYVCVSGMG